MSNKILVDFIKKLKSILKICPKNTHQLHEPLIENKDLVKIKESIKTGFVSSVGKHVDEFQSKLKKLTKSRYVILTNTGSSALHLVLTAIGINKNDEVLIPNFNYIASANSVLMCNGIPHFIDINEETLGIDTKKLKKYLNSNTISKKDGCFNKKTGKRIAACIVMHTYGYSSDIIEIKKILKNKKILMLEDSAEAIGSFHKKKHLGTFGFAGILSFNGNKTITTGGGGAILTSNKKFFKLCKHLSTVAKAKHKFLFYHDKLGYNYRMPSLNAALGITQLNKLEKILKSKKKLNDKYRSIFLNSKYLKLFTGSKNCKNNNWLNVIILEKKYSNLRNKIIKNCIKNNIFVRPGWKLMHEQSYLKKYPKMNLDNSISIYKRLICLPSSPFYYNNR